VGERCAEGFALYTLLGLPILYFVVFRYLPMVGNVIAFRKFQPGASIFGEYWVGFLYFDTFIHDPTFWNVFKNTIVLGTLTLIVSFPMPIIFALLLNELRSKKFKEIVQSISYLPHFMSVVIVVGMIFQPTSHQGTFNQLVQPFTGHAIDFMQQAPWFRTIYVTSDVWQSMGWGAILYLAALTTIDESLYEAARIDGANRLQQTLHVTLPGIAPMIVTLLILNIGNFMDRSPITNCFSCACSAVAPKSLHASGPPPPRAPGSRSCSTSSARTRGRIYSPMAGESQHTTWDGRPVGNEPPFGATVVVFRVRVDGLEVQMLHRAHHSPDYIGDWAGTPPAGARLPSEPVEDRDRRKLGEETGLELPLEPTQCGTDPTPFSARPAPACTLRGVAVPCLQLVKSQRHSSADNYPDGSQVHSRLSSD
jgi:putative aldouronate transport system permease protein